MISSSVNRTEKRIAMQVSFMGIVIAFMCLTSLPNALAIKQTPDINSPSVAEANVVDPNFAAFVAADYLPAFYSGDWEFFNHLVCYDLDGMPAAYLIVFKNPNSEIKSLEELSSFLKNASNERESLLIQIRSLQESTQSPDEEIIKLIKDLKNQAKRIESSSYMIKDFATVITGATEESPPLIRCHKGLPEIFVTKTDLERELETEKSKEKLKLRHILYLSPLDIRYEVVPDRKQEKASSLDKKISQKVLVEDAYMISSKERHLIKVAIQKQKLRDRIKQKEKMLAKINDEQRKSLEQAEKAKKTHRISQWAKFRNQYQKYLKQQKMEGEKND